MSEWAKKDEKRDNTIQDNNNNTTNTQELETTTRRLKCRVMDHKKFDSKNFCTVLDRLAF